MRIDVSIYSLQNVESRSEDDTQISVTAIAVAQVLEERCVVATAELILRAIRV